MLADKYQPAKLTEDRHGKRGKAGGWGRAVEMPNKIRASEFYEFLGGKN